MFVIACYFNKLYPNIINLINQIKEFHPDEKIVVVDSGSKDKSYFSKIKFSNVFIEDIENKYRDLGAYWYAFNKFPNEDFYYFLHDSMKIKGSLAEYKNQDLTLISYFNRSNDILDRWDKKVNKFTTFNYKKNGKGCYGPIFFCKKHVMDELKKNKVDLLLPKNKIEGWYSERAYGFFFEELGYDLTKISLYGDVMKNEEKFNKISAPIETEWQFPIEKFYGSIQDKLRSLNKKEFFFYQMILLRNKKVSLFHFLQNLKNKLLEN